MPDSAGPLDLRCCSQLRPVPADILTRVVAELANVDLPWTENYVEYQSGGWKTLALFNSDGSSQSNDLADGEPMPTEVAMRLPLLRQVIEGSGLSIMWARLLLLEPGAYLWEHTDYGAANLGRAERLRLHLPLITNPEAVLVFPSHTVHLCVGSWWKLAPDTERHAACNFGNAPRVHVILDCYVNAMLRDWLLGEVLDPRWLRAKQAFSPARREALEAAAEALLREGRIDDAESVLRRAFHHYALGATSSYDLLIEFFEFRGNSERADHWKRQRRVFLNANVPGHPFYDGRD